MLRTFVLAFLLATATLASPSQPRGNKIVGGQIAEEGEFPWMVSVHDITGALHLCGGFILNEFTVVTTAQCCSAVIPAASTVTAGDYERGQSSGDEQTRFVRKLVQHPGFIDGEVDYDICVMFTNERFFFELEGAVTKIRPAQLNRDENVPADTEMSIMGWGDTEDIFEPSLIMHKATVNLVADDVCESLWNTGSALFDPTQMVCAGDVENGGVNPCVGDGGTPLVMGEDMVVGLFSYGLTSSCGAPGAPAVYTKLLQLLQVKDGIGLFGSDVIVVLFIDDDRRSRRVFPFPRKGEGTDDAAGLPYAEVKQVLCDCLRTGTIAEFCCSWQGLLTPPLNAPPVPYDEESSPHRPLKTSCAGYGAIEASIDNSDLVEESKGLRQTLRHLFNGLKSGLFLEHSPDETLEHPRRNTGLFALQALNPRRHERGKRRRRDTHAQRWSDKKRKRCQQFPASPFSSSWELNRCPKFRQSGDDEEDIDDEEELLEDKAKRRSTASDGHPCPTVIHQAERVHSREGHHKIWWLCDFCRYIWRKLWGIPGRLVRRRKAGHTEEEEFQTIKPFVSSSELVMSPLVHEDTPLAKRTRLRWKMLQKQQEEWERLQRLKEPRPARKDHIRPSGKITLQAPMHRHACEDNVTGWSLPPHPVRSPVEFSGSVVLDNTSDYLIPTSMSEMHFDLQPEHSMVDMDTFEHSHSFDTRQKELRLKAARQRFAHLRQRSKAPFSLENRSDDGTLERFPPGTSKRAGDLDSNLAMHSWSTPTKILSPSLGPGSIATKIADDVRSLALHASKLTPSQPGGIKKAGVPVPLPIEEEAVDDVPILNSVLLALCLASVVLASPPADKYPAGISPHACPNFPFCDPLVDPVSGHVRRYADDKEYKHGYHGHHLHGPKYDHAYVPGPKYEHAYVPGPHYEHAYVPGPHYVHGPHDYKHPEPAYDHHGKAVKEYPAGVDPHACPDYPYCGPKHVTNPGIPSSVAYKKAGHYGEPKKYPAGVDPYKCPNYPYCKTH
ncbi:unnamed protein product [Cyprideis torosa]|uniref:Uncharacterized protein n=1 Tax=Cyprideis torosa TaxID=163714 RepID=A0A7R8W6T6_9CRUS|nr:unnamed protein product [Cyprideis torosa]CAG0882087.1 unnamed protein product [Cyprideis torosa]